MKILFIVPYSSEGASNRYRVEQYLPYLRKEDIDFDVRPFVFKKFYKILYLKGKYFTKMLYFVQAFFSRIIDIIRLYKYDLVFIHRESCPFGPSVFEWLIYKLKKPIIFDFDDAIFLQNFNPANSIYRFFKFPSKTKNIIKMASRIIVANQYLEEYAVRFNPSVDIIPTPIDTKRFGVIKKDSGQLTIGWVGSPTTASYLRLVFKVMRELSKAYDFVLKIVGAGEEISIPGVKVINYSWELERELQDFQSIDIGIYPLPDIPWTKGKAAFKAIQYMSAGIPVVASSVGMTKEIIQHEVNGFLADSDEEWIRAISSLIEDPGLRQRIGINGRKTIEEKYSLEVNFEKFLNIIKEFKK
ncbi:MAG: glycosyltransferase family 4 protein [Candidatus Omnitrophota bacterium]